MQEESTTQKPRNVVRVRKPEWLKIRLGDNSTFTDTKHTIEHRGRLPHHWIRWSQ